VRVIAVDIYDYKKELALLKDLPKGACLGLVSLSTGILRAAEVIIYSLRGDDILALTAQTEDTYKLNSLVRSAQTILLDAPSVPALKQAIAAAREDLIRPPQLVVCNSYIGEQSIQTLRRELGLE
jgi:GntR family transcriptional regulator